MIYTNHTQSDRTKNSNRFCNSLRAKRCCLMYWKAYFILWSGYTHSGRQQWQVKDVCLFWECVYVLDCYTEFCLKENYGTNYFGMKNGLKFVYYACCDLVIFGSKKNQCTKRMMWNEPCSLHFRYIKKVLEDLMLVIRHRIVEFQVLFWNRNNLAWKYEVCFQ